MESTYKTCQGFKLAAMQELARAGLVIRGVGALKPVIRYQVMPAYEPPFTYLLSERREELNGFRYYGIKATWRSDLDFNRLNPIEWPPTMEFLWAPIPDDFVKGLNETIASLTAKVKVEEFIVLDGTTYEIAFGLHSAIFSWSEEGPTEWNALSNIGKALATQIEKSLQT